MFFNSNIKIFKQIKTKIYQNEYIKFLNLKYLKKYIQNNKKMTSFRFILVRIFSTPFRTSSKSPKRNIIYYVTLLYR